LGVRVPPGLRDWTREEPLVGKAVKFLGEVRQETAKVIWPSRGELRESGVIVVVLSLILAVFIFGIDFILNNFLKLIL
jgi:preprotein translocase subunit SecE